jgi:flagellar hook capping protein FlgD
MKWNIGVASIALAALAFGTQAIAEEEGGKKLTPAAVVFRGATPQPLASPDRDLRVLSNFATGDVFVGVAGGKYYRYSNAGVFLEVLTNGLGGYTTGCACNAAGNLYSTDFSSSMIVVFDKNHPHTVLQTINTAANGGTQVESVVFAGNGDFYAGHAGVDFRLQRYNAAGAFQQAYSPSLEGRGTDWNDLAFDQRTMFYTSEGGRVGRFDVLANAQLADFANVGGVSYALRLLPPGDGTAGLLVARTALVLRLDGAGAVTQSYDVAGEDEWFSLNLDPNGTSFWAGSFDTGNFYRFNINSGAIEIGPINPGTGSNTVFGICLFGEIVAALCPRFDYPPTPPNGSTINVIAGQEVTFNVQASDGNATDVVGLSHTGIPAGATFVSASGNPAIGTFDWTPGGGDVGLHTITFLAFDSVAQPCTVRTVVKIQVDRPTATTLARFEGFANEHAVDLEWEVAFTDGLQGFRVYRRNDDLGEEVLLTADLVRAQSDGRHYRYSDQTVERARRYTYTLAAVDPGGDEQRVGSIQVATTLGTGRGIALGQSRPNPATAFAQIPYTLGSPTRVRLSVLDGAGRAVRTIELGEQGAGSYSFHWDGRNDVGRLMPNGMYFYRLNAAGQSLTRRLILMR